MAAPTGPFILPTSEFADGHVEPAVSVATNRLRSGAVKSRVFGAPHFTAKMQTMPLEKADLGQWDGFFANLRGGSRICLIWDPRRSYPVSYENFVGLTRHGGGAFDGTAALSSITSVRELVISTLPSDFLLRSGDWIGFIENGRYGLVQVAKDVSAQDGVATVYIEPGLASIFTTAAIVNFYRPLGEFLVDPSSINIGSSAGPQQVSFSAISIVI